MGTYNYKIVVTESISGLINSETSFKIVLDNKIYANQMNLIQTTEILD